MRRMNDFSCALKLVTCLSLFVFAAGCSGSAPESGTVVPEPAGSYGSAPKIAESVDLSKIERQAFEMINDQRVRHGCKPLVLRSDLVAAARGHSGYMAKVDKMTHRGPRGGEVDSRYDRAGIKWSEAAENVGKNRGFSDPAKVAVDSWMNSPEHRKNILHAGYTHTGIAVAKSEKTGYWYFTQVFLTP